MKKRGKWRRAEDQLTAQQRQKLSEMIRDGYTIEAAMERFGLTSEEQVMNFYRTDVTTSPLDKIGAAFSFRTTYAEVARDHVRSRKNLDNSDWLC